MLRVVPVEVTCRTLGSECTDINRYGAIVCLSKWFLGKVWPCSTPTCPNYGMEGLLIVQQPKWRNYPHQALDSRWIYMYHIVSSCIIMYLKRHQYPQGLQFLAFWQYNFWGPSGKALFFTNPSKGARQTHFLQPMRPMRSHDPKTIPLQDHKGANTVSINRAGTLALWHEERSMVDKAQCIHRITTLQSPQRSKHPASSCKYMQILTTPMPDVACELNRSFMQIYADLCRFMNELWNRQCTKPSTPLGSSWLRGCICGACL